MDKRASFYSETIKRRILDTDAKILVVGGCKFDRDIFYASGFKNVTITGLDLDAKAEVISPYAWQREDATALSFADRSFDYVVAHACIHHASRPHQMLLEMYRVSTKGILAFESRDSLLIRMLARLNLTQTYEHAAVHFNDSKCGGVDNTDIPNYVYRWTEREVEKTIQSFSPLYLHDYIYSYGSSAPCTPDLEFRANHKMLLIAILKPAYRIFAIFFKKQQNLFAFFIGKPNNYDAIFPWLSCDQSRGVIYYNKKWSEKRYKKSL